MTHPIYNLKQPQLCETEKDRWIETNFNYNVCSVQTFNWNMFNYEGASFPMTRTTELYENLKGKNLLNLVVYVWLLIRFINTFHERRWKVTVLF